MRKIIKTEAPEELSNWCSDNKDYNHSYNNLTSEVKNKLKDKLLKEQGLLCAYTGLRITLESSHIEHLKPQNKCSEWEDVDYLNLVACFPKDGGDKSYGYGAPIKSGWWDKNLFVSPLSEESEGQFRFTWRGEINPNPDGHRGAKETIKKLGLNNANLTDLRYSRIKGFFGLGARSQARPLSIYDAKELLQKISEFDSNGQLKEFCFVLEKLLPEYIDRIENK